MRGNAADVVIIDSGPALRPIRNEFSSRPMVRVGTYNRFLLPSTSDNLMPYETTTLIYDPITPLPADGTVVTSLTFSQPVAAAPLEPDSFLVRLWRSMTKPFNKPNTKVTIVESSK